MYKQFLLLSILILMGATCAQSAQPPEPSDTPQSEPDYPPSKDGFRSQFGAIVQSYRSGDPTAGRHLIDQLLLPNAEAWFAGHLTPEQSAKLTERYNRLFANYAESLENTIKAVVDHAGSELVTDLEEGKGENPTLGRPGAKPSGVISVNHPNLFYGHFKITIKKKDLVSWANLYTHQDGAFRFLGGGAWPFWVWEDGTEGGFPKGGSFAEPPSVITQVPPVYPSDARLRRIEGVVVVRLRIDKRGSVSSADVVNGNPMLAQAALEAVRMWRFKPSTMGGSPSESEITVAVNFSLH